MSFLILHHFLSSPFSEKVRRVLAYKQLPYNSVTVPSAMPKPDVVALTAGYRRTPFLQIGADIYCDTSLICDVLDRIRPDPPLYPSDQSPMARILAQWADSTLFWAAVNYNRGPHGAGYKFGPASGGLPENILQDRKAMGFDVDWVQPADAAPAYRTYLRQLDEQLQLNPYLLGSQPSIADFSAYHVIWLVHLRAVAPVDLLRNCPKLQSWADRIQTLGREMVTDMEALHAIAVAAANVPAEAGKNFLPTGPFEDEHGAIGKPVKIMAESFGKEPTHGELVVATASHYSLRRTDARAGTVHVHFPRIGYVLKTT